METLADRVTLIQEESARLTQYLHALPADAWRQPSACTQWQIQDLDIDCEGSRVIVTGRCRTWYLKQLVTHAVRSAEPQVDLWNEITVEDRG